MAREAHNTRPMKGRRILFRDARGEWRVRVVLDLFGREITVFSSSEGYKKKRDAINNYRLIFFGEWEEIDE